jgi:hypothetical protein
VTGPAPLGLEEARERLRELGYLNGRVERYLFRRAFAGRGGLFLPAILAGAFSAALAALAAVAASEPGFGDSPAAVAALLAHLFFANLFPAALLAWLLAAAADRSRAPAGLAAACAALSAGIIFFLWIAGTRSLARPLPVRTLVWAVPISAAALLLARSVRSGLLARAYAHSRVLPGRPRGQVLLAAAAVCLAAAVAVVLFRREPEPGTPVLHPSPRTERLLVVAVDGLSLDSGGADASPIRLLFSRGATGWWPTRSSGRTSPPEIWTDLSTGCPSSRHGVRALERVRPAGSPDAFPSPFGTRWYLKRLGLDLSLVSLAPVSVEDRRCLAFWEVAASAGLPSLAVGWWASGAWPGATVIDNRQILGRAAGGLDVDRLAIDQFTAVTGESVATVYLPGPDILRDDADKRAAAVNRIDELLEKEAERASRGEGVLVVLAVESHPRPGERTLGRMVVFDGAEHPVSGSTRFAGSGISLRVRPEDVAPSLLARAGVPAARDLPGRPVASLFRQGSLETETVSNYGPRVAPAPARSASSDREYLQRLKSLGYLQ